MTADSKTPQLAETKAQPEPKVLGIQEAARLVQRQAQYVRILVIKGKIAATKTVVPGTTVPRWDVDRDSLLKYFSDERTRRTTRADGRNKYVVYATESERLEAVKVLNAHGLTAVAASITRANDPTKSKEYRMKRDQKTAAPASAIAPVASMPSKEARKAAHAKARA